MSYTREQILNMPAEYGLDRLVAQYVIGVSNIDAPVQFSDKGWFKYHHDMGHFRYSTNISAAWGVVDKYHQVSVTRSAGWEETYDCRIWIGITGEQWAAQAKTAPEAICKAALLASLGESGGTGNE